MELQMIPELGGNTTADVATCNDGLVPGSALAELFPTFATLLPCQSYVSSICKASLLHEAMSKGCKLVMLPFAPCLTAHLPLRYREPETLQGSSAQKGSSLCWERECHGDGRSRLNPPAHAEANLQRRFEGLWAQ